MDEFEKTFQTITGIVLGKKLTGYRDYENWLSKNVSTQEEVKSQISGDLIFLPTFSFYHDLRSKLVTMTEAYDELGKKKLSENELASLSLSNAGSVLQNISTTTLDTQYGKNTNVVESSLYYDSHTCFRGSALNKSKCCLYSFWPRYSEYTLGCYYLFSSQFCIKCYNSENLIRCFEMSDCNNCSDSMFCHNSENLKDCMFCFNTKSKKYAIANIELPPEKYKAIKAMVLAHIHKELEEKKYLGLSIFNLGRKNGK
ncbi:MAG: hypothetical protein Q7S22_03375 [Candidatus Micrarchaeota archaeon]|nr:hypothetical protein [Candidatus Micrarchaeota archaeon]